MAVALILRVLLITAIAKCKCETSSGYHYNKPGRQFGEILKPPPPPISSLYPVPFHGGVPRPQRQNLANDAGYHYPPPPPPPPPSPNADFQFPAPFYKQYNFNFVPPPQPFTTTPSSSLFQKVSGWLFSQQSSYEPPVYNSNSIAPVKKDCNPCNLMPWIPVIRYDVGAKNLQQNLPTYGPPSPTANFQNVAQYRPQPFHSSAQEQKPPQLSPGVPHAVYGPPAQSFSTPASTYGPPSPTHTVTVPSQSPLSSPFSVETSSFSILSSSYGVPSSSINVPSSSYGIPSSSYGVPSSYKAPSSSYGVPSSTYSTPSPPASTYESSSGFVPILNNELSQYNGGLKELEPASELQLPKVTNPSGFKNSYGEPITNSYALDIPYPVSATAAESTKVKTEVLPSDSKNSSPNMSLALASPAPFTLNRGRNIHTLQPVALPNLSVSPLPPIFNARPFRPLSAFSASILNGINHLQQNSKNVNIEQSVPVAEFTHSIDYPPTVIKSPVIDLDAVRNHSKAYRNIPNGFNVENIRDVLHQASEDHIAATKSNPDVSFESTGLDFGNELYDSNIPSDFKKISNNLSNHKTEFADLRGAKDEDVDKYRTESNLQNIDSPLLYLKPSAPHKDHGNFVFAVSTSANDNDYEIYDDVPTTVAPQLPTPITAWDESKTHYSQGLVPPPEPQNDRNKPKIVQIIVPYTTNNQNSQSEYEQISQSWTSTPEDEYQGRKVPQNTENYLINSVTESYTTINPTTEDWGVEESENFDSDKLTAHAILNDLYDVKEPPFDIIKLQHTIDDWTAQEFSKHHKMPQKTRTNTKYAKQIPDEYFTTVNPIANYVTVTNNDNYDMYDHEGQSSMLYSSVSEEKNKTESKPRKEYNKIERTKTKHTSGKNEDDDGKRPHIYTAASSFRSTTTTTVAPWGKIQTSISPLTKEKVYVVTAKPWRESTPTTEKSNDFYDADSFESKKTSADNDVTASDALPFKSPRFSNRPSFAFSGSGSANVETLKSDSSYAFSKSWHQSINDLESQTPINSTPSPYEEGSQQNSSTNSNIEDDDFNADEYTTTTKTAELPDSDEET